MLDLHSILDFLGEVADSILVRLSGGHVPDPDRRCVADRSPHPAEAGHVCSRHLAELEDWLQEIAREVNDLDPTPSHALPWNYAGSGGGGGEPAFTRAPARLDPIVLSDPRQGDGVSEDGEDRHAAGGVASVLAVLHAWAREVRQRHSLARPVRTVEFKIDGRVYRDTLPALPTVGSEVALLVNQLPWIVEQERQWVRKFCRTVRVLRDQVLRANGIAEDKPLPGQCIAIHDGVECAGPLWPAEPEHTSGSWEGPGPAAIQCGTCSTRWEGPRLAFLLISIDQTRRSPKK